MGEFCNGENVEHDEEGRAATEAYLEFEKTRCGRHSLREGYVKATCYCVVCGAGLCEEHAVHRGADVFCATCEQRRSNMNSDAQPQVEPGVRVVTVHTRVKQEVEFHTFKLDTIVKDWAAANGLEGVEFEYDTHEEAAIDEWPDRVRFTVVKAAEELGATEELNP